MEIHFCSQFIISTVLSYLFLSQLYQPVLSQISKRNLKFEKTLDLQLTQGSVTGSHQIYTHRGLPYGVAEFLGMPFAKPPLGPLRFKRPVKLDKFRRNPFDATRFGPACHQNTDATFSNTTKFSDRERAASTMWNVPFSSEDCLSINVWTPYPHKDTHLRPVMLWVYGGGYFSGGSNLDVYAGHRLAALEDMVVVSFNYRVGLFGFLFLDDPDQHPDTITDKTGRGSGVSGNQGLYDQRMAMEWVRDNIISFGGDPKQVTLFGESAGASSIGIHLLSTRSQGLFSKAVMQSGSPTAPWAVLSRQEMRARSQLVVDAYHKNDRSGHHCRTSIECLQSVDYNWITASEMLLWGYYNKTERYLPFSVGPVPDGDVIPDNPAKLLKEGRFPKIPVMMGSNRNEGSFWLIYYLSDIFNDFQGSNPVTEEEYDSGMEKAFGRYDPAIGDAIRFYYRNWSQPQNPVSNRLGLDDATGEQNFMCPVDYMARQLTNHGVELYMYFLEHRVSTENWPEWMGVIHGADCEWVFGKFIDQQKSTKAEKTMNLNILKHWANFARTGNPNLLASLNQWLRWTGENQNVFALNTDPTPRVILGPRASRCAFWNNYIPSLTNTIQNMSETCSSAQSPSKSRYFETLLPGILISSCYYFQFGLSF